ncbi:helix-turn-helix transcriptional regulator [Streptomyces sp. NBC_01304]|uniref:helix-turn-helix transcriptional regulator n=1 Tax=Streptomyces sp. NBC_01304 TaxID=2903818 RepID=UPI002E0DE5DE|nr:helix-turn-helix transcriptional regulator [Streptomyces sp. NBC_01304]
MSSGHSITNRHLRAMLDVIDDARHDASGDVPPRVLLSGLRRLIPCDQAAFCELDIPTRRELTYQEEGNPFLESGHDPDAYWKWRHEYTMCLQGERSAGNMPVVQMADFMTVRELRSTGLYSNFLSPCASIMTANLPTAPGRTRVFIFEREGARPYNDRERLTLDLLRPHLIAIYRDAALRRQQPVRLTPRELDVMRAVANGLSNAAIAGQLVVSTGTVRKHLENIFHKLDVSSRTAAVARIFPAPQTICSWRA